MYSDQADEALKLYQQLSAANPKNPEYQLHMAEIYLSQGETAKARSAIDRAKVAAGNDARVRYAEVSVLEAEDKNRSGDRGSEEHPGRYRKEDLFRRRGEEPRYLPGKAGEVVRQVESDGAGRGDFTTRS